MKTYVFLFVAALFILQSCKKDYSAICESLPQPNNGAPSFGWNYVTDSGYEKAPCFNPNNGNEFVFLKEINSRLTLCTYNIQSNVLYKLFAGDILYKPDWGINNWILFDVNNDIYKIRPNGDSLTKLTTGNISCGPKWSPNGTQFIFYLYGGYGIGARLANQTGEIVDTLPYSFRETSAWRDSLIADAGSNEFLIYNTQNHAEHIIYTSLDINSYSGCCFVSSFELIWADNEGVYITDIQAGVTKKLKPTCNSQTYMFPDYSSSANKVIWGKVIATPVNATDLSEKGTIVYTYKDATNEHQIILP